MAQRAAAFQMGLLDHTLTLRMVAAPTRLRTFNVSPSNGRRVLRAASSATTTVSEVDVPPLKGQSLKNSQPQESDASWFYSETGQKAWVSVV